MLVVRRASDITNTRDAPPKTLRDHITPLECAVDLTDTVDTDSTAEQLPAVTHEFVQPTEHQVTHQQITREIHNHDVFHRVLPVVELEILPTKHYTVDPDHPGTLKEVSETEAPFRNNWCITNTTLAADGPVASDRSLAPVDSLTSLRHSHDSHASEQAEPILASKKSYMTEQGFMRTEYVWRHPPIFDMTLYNQGKTVPLRMSCMSADEFADYLASQPDGATPMGEGQPGRTHGGTHQVDELQRRSYVSLAERHAVVSQNPATNGTATEETANRTQTAEDSHQPGIPKDNINEGSLAAASTAAGATAEQAKAAVQSRHAPLRKSVAGARASWAGVSALKGKAAPDEISHGTTKDSGASDTGVIGAWNIRGKARTRLNKVREAVSEVGQRLRQR